MDIKLPETYFETFPSIDFTAFNDFEWPVFPLEFMSKDVV